MVVRNTLEGVQIIRSMMATIAACHAGVQGSIPYGVILILRINLAGVNIIIIT